MFSKTRLKKVCFVILYLTWFIQFWPCKLLFKNLSNLLFQNWRFQKRDCHISGVKRSNSTPSFSSILLHIMQVIKALRLKFWQICSFKGCYIFAWHDTGYERGSQNSQEAIVTHVFEKSSLKRGPFRMWYFVKPIFQIP